MNISAIKNYDASNGKGLRVSVFVSGCRIHCKGCHNKDAWDFNFGFKFTNEILEDILKKCSNKHICGLSILGGEPFDEANRSEVLKLVLAFKEKFPTKSIWIWTGYTISDLKKERSIEITNILRNVDVIIDGPYKEELRDVSLKYRGSSNQRILERVPNTSHVKEIH